MIKYTKYFLFAFSIALYSCNPESTSSDTSTPDSTDAVALVVEQVWATDSLFNSSESVLYDVGRDVIYVSCINGMPTDKDGNGYIAKVSTSGEIIALDWAKGLNAPKGMGIFGNTLYVTDITRLVEIDLETGKQVKDYELPGSLFLNDITVDAKGKVYFSDSEADKLYTLTNGKIEVWLDKGISKPNGVLIEPNRLLLASYGSQDFKAIDLNTKEITILATEVGAGDGVAYFGKDDHYVVSDWNGTVYLIEPDGSKNILLDSKEQKINSADIEYIPALNLLVVPTFFNNKVVAYKITHND